jgi:hypothetical protein
MKADFTEGTYVSVMINDSEISEKTMESIRKLGDNPGIFNMLWY